MENVRVAVPAAKAAMKVDYLRIRRIDRNTGLAAACEVNAVRIDYEDSRQGPAGTCPNSGLAVPPPVSCGIAGRW